MIGRSLRWGIGGFGKSTGNMQAVRMHEYARRQRKQMVYRASVDDGRTARPGGLDVEMCYTMRESRTHRGEPI